METFCGSPALRAPDGPSGTPLMRCDPNTAFCHTQCEGAPGFKVQPHKIEHLQFGAPVKNIVTNGLDSRKDRSPSQPRQAKLAAKLRDDTLGQRLAILEQLPGPPRP